MADFLPVSTLSRAAGARASRRASAPRPEHKLRRALAKKVGQAIADFDMIREGDRIMVCVSGGKDSYALLDVLGDLRRKSPVRFELIAVNVDQGWPGYDTDAIAAHLADAGVEYRMVTEDFAAIVEENIAPGGTPCSLCSRLRRGVLYNLAVRYECTKIALGHHMDDLIETLILNLFYSGKLASMPAVLHSDDGRNTVIRPLAYVPEELLVEYADVRQFPVVRCGCPSCGLPDQKRQVVKRMLAELEAREPGLKTHMLAALKNVKLSHLLDRALIPPAGGSRDASGA
jgi:tRNA 2-thiocytidine biosynthesis protein TtcA